MTLPLLISVPHAGRVVPPEVADLCLLTPQEIDADGDQGAAEIYHPLQEHVVAFKTTPVARAVVDMNRAEDDRRTDGIIKTHTCWNVPIYRAYPSEQMIERLLENHYRPYHRALSTTAPGILLGIDCHTMAATGPPIGPDAGKKRPAICLSNADGTCPHAWMTVLRASFEEVFARPALINNPFHGGHIIRAHAGERPWVQLELSRAPFTDNQHKSRLVLQALQQAMRLIDKG